MFLALACLIIGMAAGPALAQASRTTPPATTPRGGAQAQPVPATPVPGEEPLPEGTEPLPQVPEEVEEPEEPEEPPTAAERFAELQRFGMGVFGPVEPRPGAEQEDRPEETQQAQPRQQQPAAERSTATTPAPRATEPPAQPRTVLASEPVPPSYVLGPGDQLAVRVWTDAIEHIAATPVIDAEGQVYLELLGEITIAGERLSSAREMIARRYRTFFTRAEVSVGLARTRVIEVRVTGDVRRPGTHVLSGAATLFSALNAAGGPNEVGSFRAIRLVRRGEEPQVVDLYDYLLRGEIDADLSLEPNDTVFVPPMLAEFGIDGEVRRPARYEMTAPTTLAEALQLAAGAAATGYVQGAELWRVGESGIRELMNVNLRGDDAQICLQSGDLLVIPPVLEKPLNVVQLEGAVRRPGTYQVSAGMTVRDLLLLASGPAELAHVQEAVIARLGDDFSYDLLHFDLAAALRGDSAQNLALMPGDRLTVFAGEDVEAPMEVAVEGAVREPESYPWVRGARVSDLIKQAGGLLEGAYTPRANLLRLGADQRRELIPVNLGAALAGDAAANIALERGDMLVVLTRLEVAEESRVNVAGLVQFPEWYPRFQGMRVSDAIIAAGGLAASAGNQVEFTPGGVTDQVQPVYLSLRRDGEQFVVEPDPVVRDNDLVAVLGTGNLIATPPTVTIRGQVSVPGSYALLSSTEDHDTVYNLIRRAGGLLPNANPNGIVLYRLREEIIRDEQEEDLDQVIAHFNRELSAGTVEGEEQRAAGTAAQISAGLQAALSEGSATVVIPPRRLSNTQWARAVPIDGETLIASDGQVEDFPLTDGDVVVVPATPTTVTVMGAVVRAGAVPYEEGLRPLDYIARSGQFTQDARRRQTIVIRANGEVAPKALNADIRPGDIILVPSDYIFRNVNQPGTLERVLSTITSIVTGYLILK